MKKKTSNLHKNYLINLRVVQCFLTFSFFSENDIIVYNFIFVKLTMSIINIIEPLFWNLTLKLIHKWLIHNRYIYRLATSFFKLVSYTFFVIWKKISVFCFLFLKKINWGKKCIQLYYKWLELRKNSEDLVVFFLCLSLS